MLINHTKNYHVPTIKVLWKISHPGKVKTPEFHLVPLHLVLVIVGNTWTETGEAPPNHDPESSILELVVMSHFFALGLSCFSPRRCLRCNSAFLQQAHVIDCTNLPRRLASSDLLIKLPNFVKINPQFIVEQYLEAKRKSDPGESEGQLTCLEQFIRESVHQVFSEKYS